MQKILSQNWKRYPNDDEPSVSEFKGIDMGKTSTEGLGNQ